jgi:hypothetical protein
MRQLQTDWHQRNNNNINKEMTILIFLRSTPEYMNLKLCKSRIKNESGETMKFLEMCLHMLVLLFVKYLLSCTLAASRKFHANG